MIIMAKLTNGKIERIAVNLGWTCVFSTQREKVYNGGKWDKEKIVKYVAFYQASPAGEDFCFEVSYNSLDEIPQEVFDYYFDFEADEHVEMWLEAKKSWTSSIPCIQTLVDDAREIEKMVLALYNALA